MSACVPGCSGRYRVLPPLPDTRRCGTPLRACCASLTFSLHSSSRRSAWNSSVDRMARSRLLLRLSASGAAEQLARLMIAERRRLAFAAFRFRPRHAFDRVMGHGVFLAEIFEQRASAASRWRIGAAAQLAPHQVVAPGDDVRARHGPKFLRPRDAGELHEVGNRVLVSAARVPVGEVGEPFGLGRHVGEPVELGGGEQPVGGPGLGWQLVGIGHWPPVVLAPHVTIDKICYQ